ncbi:hypothetical protein [Streptomyces sp. CC228A]|uniref:hypothetical protein n=1 Tax=Streptomyces sp. CC228A TaxID=2898186 RepID=UPI001F3321AB|nr:hypothetical protein [Streptomyces sp. CC228A]
MSSVARLLPWTTEDGKACLLSTDGAEGGYLSRLADEMEAVQLRLGAELLGHVGAVLEDPKASPTELRFMVARLSESLRDALRVAESRGLRLGMADDVPEEDSEDAAPTLPAEAFG